MIFIIGGVCQGKSEFAKSFGLPVFDNLEKSIKKWLENGDDIDAKINSILEEKSVIVCTEIGCGIVPLEKTDRIWREETGRTACKIAQRAEKVYKMEAGIPQQIK